MLRMAPIERSSPSCHLTRGGVVAGAVGLVDELAEHVGQRLVDRARLEVVEEVRAELGDAVGELVADHVVRRGEAVAVGHLLAVPERVLRAGTASAGVAVVDGREERQAVVVEAVAPEAREVEVVGVARELERGRDVGVVAGARRVGLGRDVSRRRVARERVAARAGGVVGVADAAVLGGLDLVDVELDAAGLGVDEHELVDGEPARCP